MEKRISVKFKKVKLSEIRRKLNLSQTKAAECLGTDRSDLSRLENGDIPEWLKKAIKLNAFLKKAGYTLDDLDLSPYTEDN